MPATRPAPGGVGADCRKALSLPPASSAQYVAAMSAAVIAPVLSRHIAEAINYRNLDRGDYGTTF